jgi:hypothetical protein
VYRISGKIHAIEPGKKEPDKVHYSLSNPLSWGERRWGGTLYGSPESGEFHEDFLGSMSSTRIVIQEQAGKAHWLEEVLVLKPLQSVLSPGLESTLYLFSENSGERRQMLVAVETGSRSSEVVEVIGRLGPTLKTSLRRQLRRMILPLGITVGAFVGVSSIILAGMPEEVRAAFKGILHVTLLVCVPVFAGFGLILWRIVSRRLESIPDTQCLRSLLHEDGFPL